MTTLSNSTCITRSSKLFAIALCAVVWLDSCAAQAQPASTGATGAAGSSSGAAQVTAPQPLLTLTPSAIEAGTHPPVRITFAPAEAGTTRDLAAVIVTVAGQTTTRLGTPVDANTIIIDPPALDMTGDAEVRARLADREIGRAMLRYGKPQPQVTERWWLLFLYVAILVGFVYFTIRFDMARGYESMKNVSDKLLDKIPAGSLTDNQLTTLATQLQQSPAGIEGLARTTIAFTLLLIIGIAIFHIVATCQTCDREIPPVVERILTLLTGALTSVTGFYFGARAAQGGSDSVKPPSTPSTTTGGTGGAPTVTPAQATPGTDVVITGSGFGQDVGTVTFGSVAADQKGMAWNDTRIKVTVPKDARPGPAPITITRGDRHQIAIASTAFTVLPSGSTPTTTS